MNKLTTEKCREQFEQWYSRLMGTPVGVLKTLRDGDSYMETEGGRLDIAWLSWQASRAAIENEPPTGTYRQIENDGWIEWGGGDCPVASNAEIEVKFRDGDTKTSSQGNRLFVWKNRGLASDIIAYRVIENDGMEG